MSLQFGSTKTTSETGYPSYVEGAQQGLITAAGGIAAPFMQGSKYSLAGQNADQQKAAELARQTAMSAYNTDYSRDIAKSGSGYNASTIKGEDVLGQMNPFIQGVIDPTLAAMGRQKDISSAQIGARNASGVAFGGSGSALEQAQLTRSHGENVGQTVSGLLSAGYDRASQLAAQNAQAENAAKSSNAQLGLNANIAANSAANSTQDRQLSALNALLGIGNQNQQFAQQGIDIPWTNIQRLAGLLPASGSTTTNEQPNYIDPASILLGLM